MTADRFAQFPRDLAARTRTVRLTSAGGTGSPGIPALLAHPDWNTTPGEGTPPRPAPVVLWLHGRTANKELDPGRYLRWVRAGIAACAIDLPGHGERSDESMQGPERSLDVIEQVLPEIDAAVAALGAPEFVGAFDLTRVGLGGMSLGGMAALRRLCDPHPFRAAAVEATCGWLAGLYHPEDHGLPAAPPRPTPRWLVAHPRERLAALDPAAHLANFQPIPLLAVHSEADQVVPFAAQRAFIEQLRRRYHAADADPGLVELITWPETGAPQEHIGFGRFSNDAKNTQTEFLTKHLGA